MLLHMNEMFRILIEIGKVGSSKELTLSCLASTGLFFFFQSSGYAQYFNPPWEPPDTSNINIFRNRIHKTSSACFGIPP